MHILDFNYHLEWAFLFFSPCSTHQLQKIWLIFRNISYNHINTSKLLYFTIITSKIYSLCKLRSCTCYTTFLSNTRYKVLAKLPWYGLCYFIYIFLEDLYLLLIQYIVKTCLWFKVYNYWTCSLFDFLYMICKVWNILIFVIRMKANYLLIRFLVRSLNIIYFFHFVSLLYERLLVVW